MQLALVRGCTGACNAVNTTLTTDAQLQKLEEWLLGALGLAEELRSPAAPCLKASPFMRWDQSKHLVAILSCITTKVFFPLSFPKSVTPMLLAHVKSCLRLSRFPFPLLGQDFIRMKTLYSPQKLMPSSVLIQRGSHCNSGCPIAVCQMRLPFASPAPSIS